MKGILKNSNYKYLIMAIPLLFLNLLSFSQQSISSTDNANQASLPAEKNIISIDEEMVVSFLTQTLQQKYCEKNSTIELRLSRPWTPVTVTNKNGSLKLLESPNSIMPSMLVRLGWQNGSVVESSWQVVIYVKLWADVIIASKPLARGTILSSTDISYTKKDILQLRDYLTSLPENISEVELTENIAQGQMILPRSIRIKPIVRRGQLADAYHIDGALNISLKVEVMEDGASGQYIKIRNPQTRKELKGKVKDDGSIEICL